MENLGGETEENNQKKTKTKMDTMVVKPEDMDGLQMLRLAQEEDMAFLEKDILPGLEESLEQQKLAEEPAVDVDSKHEIKRLEIAKHKAAEADIDEKPKIGIASEQGMAIRKGEKNKGVERGGQERKPALVRKEVSELHGLTERQQNILQDCHVKFVLDGVVVEEDDEARVRRHPEFHELKKRLEEEEKMYAGCALGEASSNIDAIDKDLVDADQSSSSPSNLTATHAPAAEMKPGVLSPRATMDEVIDRLAEVAICSPKSSPRDHFRPQIVRNAMKDLADDDEFSELQENSKREGCQCCCRRTGKQIDEGEESEVYMTNSTYSVLNVVCPISGISVVDLDDPVRSEDCEHIYDRASALNYIASMEKDGFCLCASAGCRAQLAEDKLVADSRLWQEIEEVRQIEAALWESRMLQNLVKIDDSDEE